MAAGKTTTPGATMDIRWQSTLVLILVLAACGGERSGRGSGNAPVIRDSAGVTIVDNTGVDPAKVARWAVDTSPSVTIGTADGDSAYELASVGGVQRLANGMIVVLNGQGEAKFEFRFYDSTGKHIATHGRLGQGPGEYRWINFFGSVGGDTVIGVDFPNGRLNWLSASQGHIRSARLSEEGFRKVLGDDASGIVESLVPLGDSVYGFKAWRRIPNAASPFERAETFHIANLADGKVLDLVRYEPPPTRTVKLSRDQVRMRPAAIGRPAHVVDRARGRICALISHAAEITCIDRGGKRFIIRWQDAALPYTDEDRRADEAMIRGNWERSRGVTQEDIAKILAEREVPQRHHPVIAFQNDVEGNFWILEPALDAAGTRRARFRVLDPDGRLIAVADSFPARDVGLQNDVWIGDDVVLRVIETPDGAPAVGVFRIRKPD